MKGSGRTQKDIHPSAAPALREFVAELRAVRARANNRKFTQLGRDTGFHPTTMSRAVGGLTRPTKEVTLAFVRACGETDVEYWTRRWHEMDAARERSAPHPGRPPQASVPDRIWYVPEPGSWEFVGRRRELAAIEAGAARGRPPARNGWALCGMPGVGKSALAVQYALRHRDDYDLVWWVSAQASTGRVEALRRLAERLGIDTPADAPRSARDVLETLGNAEPYPRWLLIADNAENIEDVRDLLAAAARAPRGRLLVTSQDRDWSPELRVVPIGELAAGDATRLLRTVDPSVGHAQARCVAAELGGLPLALLQAGRSLASTGMSPAQYVELLRRSPGETLALDVRDSARSVAATLTAAIASAADPALETLLQLWAQFGPAPFARSWLHPGVAHLLPAPLADVVASRRRLHRLDRKLASRFLVTDQRGQLTMHRLVSLLLRELTPPQRRVELRRAAGRVLVAATAPAAAGTADWRACADLYQHVRATDLAGSAEPAAHDARDLVLWLVWALRAAGDHANSLALGQDAYHRWSTALGPRHLDTVLAGVNIAATRWAQHDREGALRWVIPDRVERCPAPPEGAPTGPGAPELIPGHEDTVARHRRLLATLREEVGGDHRHIITVKASLAAVHQAAGEHAEACLLFDDVVRQTCVVFGATHPHTVRATAYLARSLLGAGDAEAARTLVENTYAPAATALRARHPDVRALSEALGDG